MHQVPRVDQVVSAEKRLYVHPVNGKLRPEQVLTQAWESDRPRVWGDLVFFHYRRMQHNADRKPDATFYLGLTWHTLPQHIARYLAIGLDKTQQA